MIHDIYPTFTGGNGSRFSVLHNGAVYFGTPGQEPRETAKNYEIKYTDPVTGELKLVDTYSKYGPYVATDSRGRPVLKNTKTNYNPIVFHIGDDPVKADTLSVATYRDPEGDGYVDKDLFYDYPVVASGQKPWAPGSYATPYQLYWYQPKNEDGSFSGVGFAVYTEKSGIVMRHEPDLSVFIKYEASDETATSTVLGFSKTDPLVTDAIANAAINRGIKNIVWDGSFVCTEGFPIWSFTHSGKGQITVGNAVYYFGATENQTNIIYYSHAAGDDSNSGLTASKPIKTFSKYSKILKSNLGGYLTGIHRLQIAASNNIQDYGSFFGIKSVNRLQFNGPDVADNTQPEATLKGVDGSTPNGNQYGLRFADGMFYQVKNLATYNFGDPVNDQSKSGIVCENQSNGWHINHWAYGCGFAGANFNIMCRGYVTGGRYDSNRMGVRFYAGSVGTVGYRGTTTENRPDIRNNTQAGVQVRDQSSAHVDYCDLTNNAVGCNLINNARMHLMYSRLSNNKIGVQVSQASTWIDGEDNTYVGNDKRVKYGPYSSSLEGSSWDSEARAVKDVAAVDHTGDTQETTLKSGFFVLANQFGDVAGEKIRFRVTGNLNKAGTKSIRVRMGGVTVAGFTTQAGQTGSYILEGEVLAKDLTNQICTSRFHVDNQPSRTSILTTTINTASDREVTVTAQNSDASGYSNVNSYQVWATGWFSE